MAFIHRYSWRIVLFTAVLLVACGGAEERKAKYFERGKAYFESEKYDKAQVEFKNVLQIDPKMAEAWYYLAQINESGQNWRQAFTGYARAVDLDPNHVEARRKLARYYLLSGNLSDAQEQVDWILENFPDDPVGSATLAAIYARQGDKDAALAKAEQVHKTAPENVEAAILLADLYSEQQDLEKAAKVLEQAVEHNKDVVSLRLRLTEIYARAGEDKAAEAVVKELINEYPDRLAYRIMLAAFYSQLNDLEKTEQTMRDAIAAEPTDSRRYLLLAEFLLSRRSPEAAEQYLLASIEEHPAMADLYFGLARFYESAQRSKESEKIYRKIIDRNPGEVEILEAKGKIADIRRREGDLEEAEGLVQSVLEKNPTDNQALIVRGKLALQKNNYREAINDLRTVLKDQPESIEVLMLLALAHQGNGELGLAEDNFRKAVELQPDGTVNRLRLAEFLINKQDWDGALEQLNSVLNNDPTNFAALIGKSDVLLGKGDQAELKKVLETTQKAHPDQATGYFRMGRLLTAQEKYEDALKQFEAAYELTSNSPEMLAEIIKAEIALKNYDRAKVRLNKIIADNPKHINAHALLTSIHFREEDYDATEREYLKQIEITPVNRELYMELAGLRIYRGNTAEAMQIYDEGLKALPNDARLMLGVAGLYERQGNFDEALMQYEKILEISPKNAVAINNLAALLADHRSDPESLDRAKQLATLLSNTNQPAFLDTLGWVHFRLGEYDDAISILTGVVESEPEIPIFQYHLGMAYYKKGDTEAAKEHLAKALESKTKFDRADEAQKILDQLN